MITEFKMSELFGKYALNVLVKADSTDAEIFVVGVKNEDGEFDIAENAEKSVASFKLSKKTDDPSVARAEYLKWVEKNSAVLKAAISGEPTPVEVVEEKPVVKKAPAKKATAKKKPVATKVEEELPADNDGVEKD